MGSLPESGEIVLGKYRVVRQLGRGGMGVVFEAVNVATEGRVALKLLSPSLEDSEDWSSRMGREARAAAKLRSRFVARVIDFDRIPDGGPVLVMELLEGCDLSAELRRLPNFPIEQAVSYVIQACAGVAEAHANGIVHRDLKPGNLFLDGSSGASPMVRVLDFGLAKMLSTSDTARLTSPNEAIGTLSYMSPEQIRATKDVAPRADVWSLGVILYRALMGKLPAGDRGLDVAMRILDERPLPRVERADVSAELASVVARALEKDPERRFPDARALGLALAPFVQEPSATTKLALDELIAPPPSARGSSATPIVTDDDSRSTTRTAISADTVPLQSPAPPPHPHTPLSRHARTVFVGCCVFALVAIIISISKLIGTSTPQAATPPPPVVSIPPPPKRTAPTPLAAPAAPAPPTTTPPEASSPRPTIRPRPAPALLPSARRDENANPRLL